MHTQTDTSILYKYLCEIERPRLEERKKNSNSTESSSRFFIIVLFTLSRVLLCQYTYRHVYVAGRTSTIYDPIVSFDIFCVSGDADFDVTLRFLSQSHDKCKQKIHNHFYQFKNR